MQGNQFYDKKNHQKLHFLEKSKESKKLFLKTAYSVQHYYVTKECLIQLGTDMNFE